MNDHALDAMIYAWLVMKEKEATMEYINFGKVVNVSASVPTAIDDATYHIIIDFVPDDPDIFDDFHDNMDEILKRPDNYVLCNIEDIVKRIKEKQAFEDRIKELEGQLADAKKESDKKLCEAYMETNAVLYNSAYKFISFDKEFAEIKKDRDYWKARFGSVVEDFSKTLAANGVEFSMLIQEVSGNGKWEAVINIPELNEKKKRISELEKDLYAANKQLDKMDADIDELKNKNRDLEKELAESKTFAEVEYKWQSDGSFTATYTKHDGTKEVVGMDLAGDIDATSISCGTIPKCKSCIHYMHNPSRFAHDWCYIRKGGAGYIRKLSKEESEGPACDKFEARKE